MASAAAAVRGGNLDTHPASDLALNSKLPHGRLRLVVRGDDGSGRGAAGGEQAEQERELEGAGHHGAC